MENSSCFQNNDPNYVLKRATTKEELDALVDVIWAANHTPYEPFIQLVFPVLGFGSSDRASAISRSKDFFWTNHQAEKSSNWLYVQHVATGETVGCAQWQVYQNNPFPSGPQKLEAPWWPVKEYREFAELILNQVYKPRGMWMTRPHLALNWMAVLPEHRHRGVASRIMQWGVDKADELDIEAWNEASAMGKPLYEKFGFRSLFRFAFDTEKKGASDEWRRMEHEMTPYPFYAMWRPRKGVWDEAKMPWELGVQP